MPVPAVSPSVVVLHRVQPLTTDVGLLGRDVTVLTDGPPERVARADAPPPARVVSRRRADWPELLRSWAGAGPLEVVTNDEFALADLAELRAGLGLAPVTPRGLDGYLDKVVMKSRLAATGVAVPRFAALDRVRGELDDGPPAGVDLPVVVKPRVGSNSRGVRVVRDLSGWRSWLRDRDGEAGWEVEAFVPAPLCFVDAVVADGAYTPVLVGRYLGSLVPAPDVHVLGAVSVTQGDPLWARAAALGERVARALGTDGRFATHLELFDAGDDLVVLEVSARAPGALVSAMAREVAGHDLETTHLSLQLGRPQPHFACTGRHAAWVSVLAHPDQGYLGPPPLVSHLLVHRLPAPSPAAGRFVAAIALLTTTDHERLVHDVEQCVEHPWFG